MADSDDLKLAKLVQKYYADNPTHEISEAAKKLGETPGRIAFILDEFVIEGGKVRHAGPGQGGGWVPVQQ